MRRSSSEFMGFYQDFRVQGRGALFTGSPSSTTQSGWIADDLCKTTEAFERDLCSFEDDIGGLGGWMP